MRKYSLMYCMFGPAPKKDVEKIRKIPGVKITGEETPPHQMCMFRAAFESAENLALNSLRLGGHWHLIRHEFIKPENYDYKNC